MRGRKRLLALLCLAAVPAGTEPRQRVDIRAEPFAAVGQVNNGSYGRCTGTLIAPKRAVTAAHCLFNRRTKRFVPPQSVHFVLGYDRGEFLFQSTVATVSIGTGYDPARPLESAASDWALLDLETAAPASIRPMPVSAPEPPAGAELTAAGFGRDRAHALTATGCTRLADGIAGLLALSCQVIEGYSGGPLIDRGGQLAGIVVAAGRRADGVAATLAVPTSAWQACGAPGDDRCTR